MKINISVNSLLELAQIIFEQAKKEWDRVESSFIDDDKEDFSEKLNDLASCLLLIADRAGVKLNVGK